MLGRISLVLFVLTTSACGGGGSTSPGTLTDAGSDTNSDRDSTVGADSDVTADTSNVTDGAKPVDAADTGPTCGAPGLACCSTTGCGEYLTCTTGDAGSATCSGCIAQVASEFSYSCARRSDGSVWCWGYVSMPGKSFPSPERIGDFSSTTDVAVGVSHGCLLRDGNTHCWGSNGDGQLGTGTSLGDRYVWLAPAAVTLPGAAVKLVTGHEFTCALLTDGTTACWGANGHGQLGNGTKTTVGTPSRVIGLPSKVVDLAADRVLACAYLEDSSIWCWGDGAVSVTTTPTPVKVGTVADVTQMTVAGGIFLVTKTGGLLKQATSGAFVPATEFGPDIVQFAAGQYHQCALRRDGSVGCTGNGSSGQHANGSLSNTTSVVEAFKLGKSNVALTCGRYLTCAIDRYGAAMCFGKDDGSTSAGRLKVSCP